jgi:hypothetical protein
MIRTLPILVFALGTAAVQAATPLEDATRADPTIAAIVHRAAAAALVGDVGTLDDTAAAMRHEDEARRERRLAATGLADDVRLLAAAHRPTRDARLDALHELLDDDPDPVVERVARHAVEHEDDAAAADRLLVDDRHNRRVTVINDAVRPLGIFSGTVFLAAINPILLAGSALDSLATTAINLYHYDDLSPREREALVRYRRQLARDPNTTATPEIVDVVREINVRRNATVCADTVAAVRRALDDQDPDRARFYLTSADGLDGCGERADEVREPVAAALAHREAEAEAARWPADDVVPPGGVERDDYQALAVATVLGEPAAMIAAGNGFTQRHPKSAHDDAATLVVAVARDLAGHREGAEAALREIAGGDRGVGQIATAMLATPRFDRLDAMTRAERRHAREVAQYVLVGSGLDGRTALYTATQLGAQGVQAAESLGVFNVIGMLTRAWGAWRKDPASNQAIIDQGERFLAEEPDAQEASEVHERLAEAYERAGSYDRALLHYRAVDAPKLSRIEDLEEKIAGRLLENARKDGGEPALLRAIAHHYPTTEAADEARKALKDLPQDGEIPLRRDVLLAHPSLLGPTALDIGPALLDGKTDNGELADAGVMVGPEALTLKLQNDHGDIDRIETRPLTREAYVRARAAAEDALYASALQADPDAGEVGRFERYVPFFIAGEVGEEGGLSVAPGLKLRRDRSPDRALYE